MSTADDTSAADARAARRARRSAIRHDRRRRRRLLRQLLPSAARPRANAPAPSTWERAGRRRPRPECAPWPRSTADERPPRTRARRRATGASSSTRISAQPSAIPSDTSRRDRPVAAHAASDGRLARRRARAQRWPDRARARPSRSLAAPDVPWQRAGEDGTHYVSFAEWMCPINCIEPARCPHTRGARTLELARRACASTWTPSERPRRAVDGPFVFHCSHRAYGVGMIDVADVVGADAAIAERAARGMARASSSARSSHCHGALAPSGRRLTHASGTIPVPSRTSSGEI